MIAQQLKAERDKRREQLLKLSHTKECGDCGHKVLELPSIQEYKKYQLAQKNKQVQTIDYHSDKKAKIDGRIQNGGHVASQNYQTTRNDNKKKINFENNLNKAPKLATLLANPKFLEEDEFESNQKQRRKSIIQNNSRRHSSIQWKKLPSVVAKEVSKNLHKNFLDLNPEYHKQRHQRAVKVANMWLDYIKKDLNDKVQNERRRLFNMEILNGRKLTYEELQKLNSTWKMDYIKLELIQDTKTMNYVQRAQMLVEDELNDNANAQWYIQDQREAWDQANEDINKMIAKKKIEFGITKKDMTFYFQEFDIYDTRIAQKECWICKQKNERECPIHKLKQMENPLIKEEQFQNALLANKKKKVIQDKVEIADQQGEIVNF